MRSTSGSSSAPTRGSLSHFGRIVVEAADGDDLRSRADREEHLGDGRDERDDARGGGWLARTACRADDVATASREAHDEHDGTMKVLGRPVSSCAIVVIVDACVRKFVGHDCRAWSANDMRDSSDVHLSSLPHQQPQKERPPDERRDDADRQFRPARGASARRRRSRRGTPRRRAPMPAARGGDRSRRSAAPGAA